MIHFVNGSNFAFGPQPRTSFLPSATSFTVMSPVTLVDSSLLECYTPIIVIFLLLYILLNYIVFLQIGESDYHHDLGGRRVLLVTAHPDDECMFFGPLITQLTSLDVDVYLVCLSDGGYDAFGPVRKRELWASCQVLGLRDSNIGLYRHDLLPDNPRIFWCPKIVGKIVLQTVETLSIDTLITFDDYGVSGHKNHCSIYNALKHLQGASALPNYCQVFVLESVNMLRKYSMCIDLFLSYFTSHYIYITSQERRVQLLEAMSKHSSQLVWYRRLYLIFSRYLYINTFKTFN